MLQDDQRSSRSPLIIESFGAMAAAPSLGKTGVEKNGREGILRRKKRASQLAASAREADEGEALPKVGSGCWLGRGWGSLLALTIIRQKASPAEEEDKKDKRQNPVLFPWCLGG